MVNPSSPANLNVKQLAIAYIPTVMLLGFFAALHHQEQVAIANCKVQGGTPIYKTEVRSVAIQNYGTYVYTYVPYEEKIFDGCGLSK
jgi:hypothetical protein